MISRETHARVLGHHMLEITPQKRDSDRVAFVAAIAAATIMWLVVAWIVNAR